MLLVSACSVSINTGSTPTPSASPKATPSPQPTPVSVVITAHLDSGRCQTSGNVTVVVGGRDLGTMNVVNQLIPTDRLTVMVAPGEDRYSLKGTAFVQSNGQAFSLKVSGQGEVQVNQGPNSWTLQVDGSRLPANVCPSQGSSWPLVVQTS